MNFLRCIKMIGLIPLSMLLFIGCSAPTLIPSSQTPTLASTYTPAPPTLNPTPETINLQAGDTFNVDTYQVKLIQVEKRSTIVAFNGDKVGSTNPKKSDNSWLVLVIEISNIGDETSPLALDSSSATLLQEGGSQIELSSVGVSAPSDSAIILGFIDEKKLVKGFIGTGANGHIFVLPEGVLNLLLAGGERNIISAPIIHKWDLGNIVSQGATHISLLFEVPANAENLNWKFLDSHLISLPEPQTTSLPDEHGPTFTLSLVQKELCQIAEQLELECP